MLRRFRHRHGVWVSVGAASVAVIAAVVASACLVSQDGSPYLIDGGGLGACSENEAKAIPASMCPNALCCGAVAFALCSGSSYSDCSCTLLDGSVLVNDAAEIPMGGDCGEEEGGAGGDVGTKG
jgi:hypothetical protein